MTEPVADEDSLHSADQALCELLGISSLNIVSLEEENEFSDCRNEYLWLPKKCKSVTDLVRVADTFVVDSVRKYGLSEDYQVNSVCIFPEELSVPAEIMRRLTDELVWGGDKVKANRTYESVKFWKEGAVYERRTLTRLENLNSHLGWNQLCNDYIRRCISAVTGKEMVLYKTKLNLKPAGGSGFAPHLDAPSLKVALGDAGPRTFVTVMVAIDNMTVGNGCLRIAKGRWSEERACATITPETDGNPDAEGRAGAIPLEVAASMVFEDVCCTGGTIIAFNGWAPHRSSPNKSDFARRAVFLTYNPASEGYFHDKYYDRMAQIRNAWRSPFGITQQRATSPYEPSELTALATIPRK